MILLIELCQVAASKGLIAGPLKLIMTDGSTVSCLSDHDNIDLIPPTGTIHQVDFASTKWILVVEKEARGMIALGTVISHTLLTCPQATFRTLAASQYWRNCVHGQGIIVTVSGRLWQIANVKGLEGLPNSRAKGTRTSQLSSS